VKIFQEILQSLNVLVMAIFFYVVVNQHEIYLLKMICALY